MCERVQFMALEFIISAYKILSLPIRKGPWIRRKKKKKEWSYSDVGNENRVSTGQHEGFLRWVPDYRIGELKHFGVQLNIKGNSHASNRILLWTHI